MASAIVGNDLRRTTLLNGTPFQATGIPTDASAILAGGIPTASLISGPVYLYDAADTFDKVLVGELQEVAQAFAEIIDDIDTTPSDGIGVLPPEVALELGRQALANAGEKGTEESVDRYEDEESTGTEPSGG